MSRLAIGVISDTHGLLRPGALAALRGSDHIVHAGDIGGPAILAALAAIAPVTAVRGNNDRDAWADDLPETAVVDLAGTRVLVIHDVSTLAAATDGAAVVVSGHSHRPSLSHRDGVLYLNPGSAGPRRFSLPVALARLEVEAGVAPRAHIIALDA
jgi:putative phosphoesterase